MLRVAKMFFRKQFVALVDNGSQVYLVADLEAQTLKLVIT